jgi:hypothetical protein
MARTLSFYFGAIWLYVALIAVFKRQELGWPLLHEVPSLRRDTAGAICFVGSALLYTIALYLEPME